MEKKFEINNLEAMNLKRLLKISLEEDSNNGTYGYEVRSLYFDSIYDDDYFDKEEGLENRKKIRLRTYSGSQIVKLEVKEKKGENQLKRSLIISKEEGMEMINGNYSFLIKRQGDFPRDIYLLMTERLYRPKTLVTYNREAFIVRGNDTRITFDSKLKSNEGNFDIFSKNISMYPIYTGTIMEVKYRDFLFDYIKKIIRGVNKKEVSVSKYILGRQMGHR